MKKNFLTLTISSFLILTILYFLFFLFVHFENYEKNPSLFTSTNKLNFHKNYSKKLHHLRDMDGTWEFDFDDVKTKPENYLFTTINPFVDGRKNILIQGDSFIERFIFLRDSYKLFNDFSKKNNFGLVISGITSYSPSLMKLQYEILKKDFNIQPTVVVAYIDQSDIGDELCRYKDKRLYNKKNNLVAVKNETHSRAAYDYTKVYNISEIVLSDKSKLNKTFKVANFYIRYAFVRAFEKYNTIIKYGWKHRDVSKCRYRDINKYLIYSSDNEISYFEDRVKEYLNLLLSDKKIQKIFLVTHPHIGHIYGYKADLDEKRYFTINVSEVIEKIVKNEKRIYYLNFSKLISHGEINLEKSPFIGSGSEKDWDSHLIEEYQTNVFGQKIIDLLK